MRPERLLRVAGVDSAVSASVRRYRSVTRPIRWPEVDRSTSAAVQLLRKRTIFVSQPTQCTLFIGLIALTSNTCESQIISAQSPCQRLIPQSLFFGDDYLLCGFRLKVVSH